MGFKIASKYKLVYTANIKLEFDLEGSRDEILPEMISYVMVDRDYENQVLPLIYICINVNHDLQNKIIMNKEKGRFYIEIDKQMSASNIPIAKKSISGLYTYIPSTTNPNFREDLSESSDIVGNAYTAITIGLVSVELTNNLRRTFNGIFNEIDQKTLLAMAVKDTNCVLDPILYNWEFPSIVIPPLTSRYKLIDFIFDKNNFYDTYFRFFMDYDRSYLLSKTGEPVNAEDGQLDTIIVDIASVMSNDAYDSGMEIKNGGYYINVNPADSNVMVNQGIEKVANTILAVQEDIYSEQQKLELNINNVEGSTEKDLLIRTDNAALYKNELETNTVTIQIAKQEINGDIFTPNKCILVNNYGDYSQYDGKFLLIDKKEIYRGVGGEFIMSTVVSLKKVNNIIAAMSTASHGGSGITKPGTTTTTTASSKQKSTKANKKVSAS